LEALEGGILEVARGGGFSWQHRRGYGRDRRQVSLYVFAGTTTVEDFVSEVKLDTARKNAWIASYVAHGLICRRINDALEAEGCVSMEIYDVLLNLEEAPEHRLRMSELADRVLFSRSGITRLVDRLEKQGLLERVECPGDRRACHACLTPEGLTAREQAWPVYERVIREQFGSSLSDGEARTIANAFRRMVDAPSLVGFVEA
jgi:DNA-binding MarR family transcriptional regulator